MHWSTTAKLAYLSLLKVPGVFATKAHEVWKVKKKVYMSSKIFQLYRAWNPTVFIKEIQKKYSCEMQNYLFLFYFMVISFLGKQNLTSH